MLTQIAIDEDLIVHQIDFKNDSWHADSDKEFVEQLEGYEKLENCVKLVLKLNKFLHGLCHSDLIFIYC